MATIAGIVAQSGSGFDDNNQDFDILLSAVQTAGLVDALNDSEADFTVFAPTDAAFIRLAQDFGFEGTSEAGALDTIVGALTDLGDGDPLPVLTNVLLYHVSPGAKVLDEVQSSSTVSTLLDGATLTPSGDSLVDNEPDLIDPSFVPGATDIVADNGIVQAIDRVLIPLDIPGNTPTAPEPELPTIAGLVASSGDGFDSNNQDFDILLSAVQTAGLVEALNDAEADLTVFAPTDAAFIQLAQDLGFRGVDEAGAFGAIANTLNELGDGDLLAPLTDILLYHVSPEAKSQAHVQAEGRVETLLTDADFTVQGNELMDNEPDLLNPRFIPELADVAAANGTVQGIDRVLLPLDLPGNETRVMTGSGSLFGDQGNDQLNGGDGSDRLFGNGGSDILRGGEGSDSLFGGHQNDLLLGGDGDDQLYGNGGADVLIGGAGHDRIFGGSGDEVFDGGLGNDDLYLNGGADRVVLRQGDGVDRVFGFHLGLSKFSLADGLTFADLNIQQGSGMSELFVGNQLLAQVVGVSASSLSQATNFVMA